MVVVCVHARNVCFHFRLCVWISSEDKRGGEVECQEFVVGKIQAINDSLHGVQFFVYSILSSQDIKQPVSKTLYDLINGVGHMWFLPMLFWCFVGVWLIEKLQFKAKWMLPLLLLCSVFSFLPLPLRMGNAMYYIFFFYVGYFLQKEDIKLDRFYTLKYCIFAIVAFCVLFPTLTLLKEKLPISMEVCGLYLDDNQIVIKLLKHSFSKLIQIVYSSCGLFMLFIMIGYFELHRRKEIKNWVIEVGRRCFGVYLLQQFILTGLYEYTKLPTVCSCFWLPWIGFVLALLGSLIIAHLLVKTKIGLFLIG